MKHDWKISEKTFYLPKEKPELITIPEFRFFTIEIGRASCRERV